MPAATASVDPVVNKIGVLDEGLYGIREDEEEDDAANPSEYLDPDIEVFPAQRRGTQYSTLAIRDMVAKGVIADIEPDARPDGVWSQERQSDYINSILCRAIVPPIVLAVYRHGETDTLFCVDGKQRLTALVHFMNNRLPYLDTKTMRGYWYRADAINGKTPAFSKALRDRFNAELIICVEQQGIDEQAERGLYLRLQYGRVPTSADLLAQRTGPWPDFVRELVQTYIAPRDRPGLAGLIKTSRALDFLFAAQLALLISYASDPLQSIDFRFFPTAANIDRFFLDNHVGPDQLVRKRIRRTFDRYVELAHSPTYGSCLREKPGSSETLSPIELLFAGLLIYYYRETADDSQLRQMVRSMQESVRTTHRSPRFKKSVADHLHEAVKRARLPSSLAVPPVTDARRSYEPARDTRRGEADAFSRSYDYGQEPYAPPHQRYELDRRDGYETRPSYANAPGVAYSSSFYDRDTSSRRSVEQASDSVREPLSWQDKARSYYDQRYAVDPGPSNWQAPRDGEDFYRRRL